MRGGIFCGRPAGMLCARFVPIDVVLVELVGNGGGVGTCALRTVYWRTVGEVRPPDFGGSCVRCACRFGSRCSVVLPVSASSYEPVEAVSVRAWRSSTGLDPFYGIPSLSSGRHSLPLYDHLAIYG